MTNADKYLKDVADLEELSKDIVSYIKLYGGFDPKDFFEDESWCNQSTKAKPTLTDDERVILRNINNALYKGIGRNVEGLYLVLQDNYSDYPKVVDHRIEDMFNKQFQFIKERRRIFY